MCKWQKKQEKNRFDIPVFFCIILLCTSSSFNSRMKYYTLPLIFFHQSNGFWLNAMCASSYKQYRHVLKYKYGRKLFWYKEITGKWAHRCAITYQLLENYQKIHKTSIIPWLIFVILVFSCWLYGISRRTDAQNYWWKGPFQTSIRFFPLRQESILAVMGWEAWYILGGDNNHSHSHLQPI